MEPFVCRLIPGGPLFYSSNVVAGVCSGLFPPYTFLEHIHFVQYVRERTPFANPAESPGAPRRHRSIAMKFLDLCTHRWTLPVLFVVSLMWLLVSWISVFEWGPCKSERYWHQEWGTTACDQKVNPEYVHNSADVLYACRSYIQTYQKCRYIASHVDSLNKRLDQMVRSRQVLSETYDIYHNRLIHGTNRKSLNIRFLLSGTLCYPDDVSSVESIKWMYRPQRVFILDSWMYNRGT
jgi:hypothetical protein